MLSGSVLIAGLSVERSGEGVREGEGRMVGEREGERKKERGERDREWETDIGLFDVFRPVNREGSYQG